jgi:molecular chaperone DnaK
MVYGLEKLMRENKDKIPEEEAKKIQTEIDNTKKAVESENIDDIKKAMEALSQASHKMTEMMYQQASQQQQAQQGPQQQQSAEGQAESQASSKESAEEEVIDAEVVDEDKDKK